MKCVVLAAGKGTRMLPLTLDTPKPLLEVAGRPLLEHIMEAFPEEVDEYILVVGYLGNKIQDYFGSEFNGKKISYVIQDEPMGTFHALSLARKNLKSGERFFVVHGDDLHGAESIRESLKHPRALIVSHAEDPRPYGVVRTNLAGQIIEIEEKPEKPKTNLVSTGLLLLDCEVFNYPPDVHSNGEYYLTSSLSQMLEKHPLYAVESSFWFPVSTPSDLEACGSLFTTSLSVEN